MPLAFQELVTPRGRPYVRVAVSGVFDLAEAEEYVERFSKTGPYHLKPSMSVVPRGTEYTTAARKQLLKMGDAGPTATVTTSPLVRAAVNLMLRLAGKSGTLGMFATEAEAVAWLDKQIG
jgi:hypothetical protein